MSYSYLKPVITGAVAVGIDKMFLGETDLTKSIYFGTAVAGGTFIGGQIGNMLPTVVPTIGFIDGKTLEVRLAEIGASAGLGYAINTQILKNDYQYSQMYNKLAAIAVSEVLGEYITDYLDGTPVSYFK